MKLPELSTLDPTRVLHVVSFPRSGNSAVMALMTGFKTIWTVNNKKLRVVGYDNYFNNNRPLDPDNPTEDKPDYFWVTKQHEVKKYLGRTLFVHRDPFDAIASYNANNLAKDPTRKPWWLFEKMAHNWNDMAMHSHMFHHQISYKSIVSESALLLLQTILFEMDIEVQIGEVSVPSFEELNRANPIDYPQGTKRDGKKEMPAHVKHRVAEITIAGRRQLKYEYP